MTLIVVICMEKILLSCLQLLLQGCQWTAVFLTDLPPCICCSPFTENRTSSSRSMDVSARHFMCFVWVGIINSDNNCIFLDSLPSFPFLQVLKIINNTWRIEISSVNASWTFIFYILRELELKVESTTFFFFPMKHVGAQVSKEYYLHFHSGVKPVFFLPLSPIELIAQLHIEIKAFNAIRSLCWTCSRLIHWFVQCLLCGHQKIFLLCLDRVKSMHIKDYFITSYCEWA